MKVPHNKQVLLNKISTVRLEQAKHKGDANDIIEAERKFKGLDYEECEFLSIKDNPKIENGFIAEIKVPGRGYTLTNQRWVKGKLEVVSGIFARTVANQEQLDKVVKPGLYIVSSTGELVVILREDDEFEEVFTHLGYYYEEDEFTKGEDIVRIDSVIAEGEVRLVVVKEDEDGGCVITSDNLKLTTTIENLLVGDVGEVTATLLDDDKNPVVGAEISMGHLGHSALLDADSQITDAEGKATFLLEGKKEGSVFLQAFHGLEQDSNRLKVTVGKLVFRAKDLEVTGEWVTDSVIARVEIINNRDEVVANKDVVFTLKPSQGDTKSDTEATNADGVATHSYGEMPADTYSLTVSAEGIEEPVTVNFDIKNLPVIFAFKDEKVEGLKATAKLYDTNGSVIPENTGVVVNVNGKDESKEVNTDKKGIVSYTAKEPKPSLEETKTTVIFKKEEASSEQLEIVHPPYVPVYTAGKPLLETKGKLFINTDIDLELSLTETNNLFLDGQQLTVDFNDENRDVVSDHNGLGLVKVRSAVKGEVVFIPGVNGKLNPEETLTLTFVDPDDTLKFDGVELSDNEVTVGDEIAITGSVLNELNKPMAGSEVTVTVKSSEGETAYTTSVATDNDGNFTVNITAPTEGEFTVELSVNGVTETLTITVVNKDVYEFADVKLADWVVSGKLTHTAGEVEKGTVIDILTDGEKTGEVLTEEGGAFSFNVERKFPGEEDLKENITLRYEEVVSEPIEVLHPKYEPTYSVEQPVPEGEVFEEGEPITFKVKVTETSGRLLEGVELGVNHYKQGGHEISESATTLSDSAGEGTVVIQKPLAGKNSAFFPTLNGEEVKDKTVYLEVRGNVLVLHFTNMKTNEKEVNYQNDVIRVTGKLVRQDGTLASGIGTIVELRNGERVINTQNATTPFGKEEFYADVKLTEIGDLTIVCRGNNDSMIEPGYWEHPITAHYKPVYKHNKVVRVKTDTPFVGGSEEFFDLQVTEAKGESVEGLNTGVIIYRENGTVAGTYPATAVTDAEGKSTVRVGVMVSGKNVRIVPTIDGKEYSEGTTVYDITPPGYLPKYVDVVLEQKDRNVVGEAVTIKALFVNYNGEPMNGTGTDVLLMDGDTVIDKQSVSTPNGVVEAIMILSKPGNLKIRLMREMSAFVETPIHDEPVEVKAVTDDMTFEFNTDKSEYTQHDIVKVNVKAKYFNGNPSTNDQMVIKLGTSEVQATTKGANGADVQLEAKEFGELKLSATVGNSVGETTVSVKEKLFNPATARFVDLIATPPETLEIDEINVSGILMDEDRIVPKTAKVTVTHHDQSKEVDAIDGKFYATFYATGDGNEGNSEEVVTVSYGDVTDTVTIIVDDTTRVLDIGDFNMDSADFASGTSATFKLSVVDQHKNAIPNVPVSITRVDRVGLRPTETFEFVTNEFGLVEDKLPDLTGDFKATAKILHTGSPRPEVTREYRQSGKLAIYPTNFRMTPAKAEVDKDCNFNFDLVNQFGQPIGRKTSAMEIIYLLDDKEFMVSRNLMTHDENGKFGGHNKTMIKTGKYICRIKSEETFTVTDFPFTVIGDDRVPSVITSTSMVTAQAGNPVSLSPQVKDGKGQPVFLAKVKAVITHEMEGDKIFWESEVLTDSGGWARFESIPDDGTLFGGQFNVTYTTEDGATGKSHITRNTKLGGKLYVKFAEEGERHYTGDTVWVNVLAKTGYLTPYSGLPEYPVKRRYQYPDGTISTDYNLEFTPDTSRPGWSIGKTAIGVSQTGEHVMLADFTSNKGPLACFGGDCGIFEHSFMVEAKPDE